MDNDDLEFDITEMSTITIDSYNGTAGDITFDTSNNMVMINNGITWNQIDTINITGIYDVEFRDKMPDIKQVEAMCEEYPGLDKAYENFKTFYKLVEQDWRGKQKEHE
jgi:hypothetical protein